MAAPNPPSGDPEKLPPPPKLILAPKDPKAPGAGPIRLGPKPAESPAASLKSTPALASTAASTPATPATSAPVAPAPAAPSPTIRPALQVAPARIIPPPASPHPDIVLDEPAQSPGRIGFALDLLAAAAALAFAALLWKDLLPHM